MDISEPCGHHTCSIYSKHDASRALKKYTTGRRSSHFQSKNRALAIVTRVMGVACVANLSSPTHGVVMTSSFYVNLSRTPSADEHQQLSVDSEDE